MRSNCDLRNTAYNRDGEALGLRLLLTGTGRSLPTCWLSLGPKEGAKSVEEFVKAPTLCTLKGRVM